MSVDPSANSRILLARLGVFYGATLAFSWTYWGWMFLTGQMVQPDSPATHLPGLAGPLVGAMASTAVFEGRAGLIDLLRRCLRLPVRHWLALLFVLLPLLLMALAILIDRVRGTDWPAPDTFFGYPGVPPAIGWVMTIVLVLLLNGFGEEVGWRGYALEWLVVDRSALKATLWVSLLWLVWHLPLFFVHRNMADMVGPAFVGWAIGLLLGAFVLSWLYLKFQHSILVCALWHTAYNFSVATPAAGDLGPALVSTMVMVAGIWAARALRDGRMTPPH